MVFDSLRGGASGFMLKDAPAGRDPVQQCESLPAAKALLAPAITRSVIEEFVRQRPAVHIATGVGLHPLTAREVESVAVARAPGLSTQRFAMSSSSARRTAKTHVAPHPAKAGAPLPRSSGYLRL